MSEAGAEQATVREEGAVTEAETATSEELAALREALLEAYPEAVPELVGGGSVAALLASLGPARAAWERVAAAVQPGEVPAAPAAVPPPVPAGSAPPVAVDLAALPATEKIRRGLAARR